MKTLFKNKIFIILLCLFSWLICMECSPEKNKEQNAAIVGSRKISLASLKRSFQLEPKWMRGLTVKQAWLSQLDYLIDEKLLAQEMEKNIQNEVDSVLIGYLSFIEQKETIKAFYRKEVAANVIVSENEYERAYQLLKKEVKFRYISTPDMEAAHKYYTQWKNETFEQLEVINLHRDAKYTSGWVSFGDIPPQIEQKVFAMKTGEISEPQKIDNTFYVFKLVEGRINKFMSEMDFALAKNKIRKTLFEQKAAVIANTYIKNIMQDKELKVKKRIFDKLAATFTKGKNKIYASDNPDEFNFSIEDSQQISINLSNIKNLPLAVYKNGQMTVGQFIEKLNNRPRGFRPKITSKNELKDFIGIVVRDDILYREARLQKIDKLPEVIKEVEIQKDKILALYWSEKEEEKIKPSQTEIAEFTEKPFFRELKDSHPNIKPERYLRIRELVDRKIAVVNKLREETVIQIDTILVFYKIINADSVITYDPIKIVTRELY